MEESDLSTKRSLKSISKGKNQKKKTKKSKKFSSKKDRDDYYQEPNQSNELYLSIKNKNNIKECLSHLDLFFTEINSLNLSDILTEKNITYFQKLSDIENIQIDLYLTKLYNKILSSDKFYTEYFSEASKRKEKEIKINKVLALIEEGLKTLENLEDNVISLDNFELKGNLLKMIKFIKINLKDDIDDEDKQLLENYINDLPQKFYSPNYLEIMKYKNKVYKNNYELLKNIETIDDLFSDLQSYYEQLSAIEMLLNDIELEKDNNTKNNFISVSKKDIKQKKKSKKKSKKREDSDDDEDEDETDISTPNRDKITERELISYGQFLINLCIYKKFILKPKESKKFNKKKNKKGKKQKNKLNNKKRKKQENEEEEGEEDNEEDDEESSNKEDTEEENEDEEEEESEDNNDNCINLFVIDAVKNVNGRIQKKSNENIDLRELLRDKVCISLNEHKNLFEIIQKNIQNFKNLTKKSKNSEIKKIKEKLDLYLTSFTENKCIPINPDIISGIKYYCNFTKNSTIVPNRDSKVYYIENPENQKGLLYIEFFLDDTSKDIIFTISRYDTEKEEFNPIYNSEKINKKCKLCIYFEEKSLYQLEFNNEYSWLNTKEVNYNISLFKILDNNSIQQMKQLENKENKKDENNISNDDDNIINTNLNINKINEPENNENNNEIDIKKEIKVSQAIIKNTKEIKFYCNNDNINYTFNCNKIYKRIKDYKKLEKNNLINKSKNEISILLYKNNIRFITFDENNKIKYTLVLEENQNFVSKNFFNKTILDYIKENYKPDDDEENKNKVIINVFSQNNNLSKNSPKVKELISALEDYSINNNDQFQNKIYIQFLQKLGFYPDKKIENYDLKYNLYDFTDQCLIYHLYLTHIQEIPVESSTLVMIFNKDILNITALNEGAIYHNFKKLEKNWSDKYYSKIKMNDLKSICNFISSLSDSFDGLDLALCCINNDEKKEEIYNLFKQIKIFVEENIDEQINVYIYDENDFISDIIKYIGLFCDDS